MHDRRYEGAELAHDPLDPLHRILPYHESTAEYQVQKHKEQREGQPLICHEGIYPVCQCVPSAFSLIRLVCFRYRSLDEGVFCVHEGRLNYRVSYSLQGKFVSSLFDLKCLNLKFSSKNIYT